MSVGAAKASDWDAHFEAAMRYSEVDTLVPLIEERLTALRRSAGIDAAFEAGWWVGIPDCFDRATRGVNLPALGATRISIGNFCSRMTYNCLYNLFLRACRTAVRPYMITLHSRSA